MDEIFLVNSASFQDFEVSASLRAGPGITVDFSAATQILGNFTASYIAPGSNTTASVALVATSASHSETASFAPANPNIYAGLTTSPLIVDNTSSYEVFVETSSVNLYDNIRGEGLITSYPIPSKTFIIPASATASFIYATSNNVTASYEITDNFNDLDNITKVLVATVYRADIDLHQLETNNEGLALANKILERLQETEKFTRESGFTLFQTGSRNIFITAGQVWFGATQISEGDFDSRISESVASPYHEVHWAYHSASQWIIPVDTLGQYNNSYYDNGTDLIALTSDYYVCNYIFRILGDNAVDEDAFVVIGTQEYVDLASAQNDKLPQIPGVLEDVSLLVGRIIVQSGSNSGTVESAFTTNFGQSLVTSHNALSGIQGGAGGEYYHMTLAEYTGTGTGVMVRQNGPTITGLNATGSLNGTASHANHALSASYAVSASRAETAGTATAISFVPVTATSASWASSSISASFADNAANANAISFVPIAATSASWVSASATINTSSYANTASYSNTASFAENAANANAIDFVPAAATSASWASSSISASYSTNAGNSYAINFVPPTATSASWVSASAHITTAETASFVTASNVVGAVSAAQTAYIANAINFVPEAANSASWVSASAFITTAQTASYVTSSNIVGQVASALLADTASYASTIAQQTQITGLTASAISTSVSLIAPPPTFYNNVATKDYVDNATAQANTYYFRTGSSGIVGTTEYFVALDLGTELSSSESSFDITSVSSSQYVAGFITPAIGITALPAGNITVHYHAYFNAGGSRAIDLQTELYTYSASVESEIAIDSPRTLGGNVTDQYSSIITLTSSLHVAKTDRLLIKFKVTNAAGLPTLTMTVDGNTSAGVSSAIPSSNYVLKSGDTMTGNLTAPYFIGTASYAESASWAPGGQGVTPGGSYDISASYASASMSSSYALSASWAPGGQTGPAESASWASQSLSASYITASGVNGAVTTAVTAYVANAITFVPETAYSASWVSASAYIINSDTASFVTASNVQGAVSTAVLAYTAETASLALATPASIFSRGGTLYNGSYIPNVMTWITVWRAPFNCTASAFNTIASTNAGRVASASVNARRNSSLNLLTASGYPITASGNYVALGPTFLSNNLFSIGDELEVGFIGTTGSVQQINVQIDFTR